MDKDVNKIEEVLTRGVENIFPTKEALKQRLLSGKKLKIYIGIDPTGPDLHLGHGITLRKLRQFQDLGHKIILLIGDFTGMIGDPTGKGSSRVQLTREQVLKNAEGYKKQTEKILDFKSKTNPVKILFQSKWLDKLTLKEVIGLMAKFTVQQMMERDMFQERIRENNPIGLHELIYPLMQGYDSVAMNVDMEIGGNDQTFNMLVGRDLARMMLNKEKFVLTTKLLTDPTGKKMGKTEDNMIILRDSAENMFGKVMSWPDTLIALGFEICTNLNFEAKENPRDAKMRLAYEIVKIYRDNNQVLFKTEQLEFLSRLIEGNFPDYSAIIPKKFSSEVVLDKQEFAGALKLARLTSRWMALPPVMLSVLPIKEP